MVPQQPLSEQILQRRLDAGLAIAGGSRGSLTKALTTPSSAPLLHLEMTKLALIIQRNESLLQKCREESNVDSTMNDSMQDQRNKLETAKAQFDCWQTYEGLATAIMQKHVISEAQLNFDIAEIDMEYTKTKEKLEKARATASTRAAQCHLLQQCVQDLKQSVDEDAIMKEADSENKKQESKEMGGEDVVMKDAPSEDEGEDEEGELYGDLDNHL